MSCLNCDKYSWYLTGCGKKRSDPGLGSSNSAAAEALAEVLANDMATGDVDDWEQYMLKGMELVDSNNQLGILPSGDDVSYLRKKREILLDDDEDFANL